MLDGVKNMEVRHNAIKLSSIESFLNVRGSINQQRRDVYFLRCIGEMPRFSEYIQKTDREMQEKMARSQLIYTRIPRLPRPDSAEALQFYEGLYRLLEKNQPVRFQNIRETPGFQTALAAACRKTAAAYRESEGCISDTMVKNLVIKLLFWADSVLAEPLSQWSEGKCIKVLAGQVQKPHEYLFYLFLTFLGCDVLLLENQGDLHGSDSLLRYSHPLVLGPCGTTALPDPVPYKPAPVRTPPVRTAPVSSMKTSAGSRSPVLVIPEHPGRKSRQPQAVQKPRENSNTEKSFEELAQLASSIVMIAIQDRSGEVVGTGSGIMIGRNGYILTNNHVASAGVYFSVRIEDDEEVYTTREVIKYNPSTDLAVIRINRQLTPLPVYSGSKSLVRGQKVVAIGSPLGLFNSVSDGIISGFRRIGDVDMIQFTAPISHGSSGGAVLNMYGQLIGISTAGIDSGQNINLAIGYENIRLFAGGFMQ